MKISGKLVDIHSRSVYPVEIYIKNGIISDVKKISKSDDVFILPGLIDSHVHVESSMLTPGSFALACVPHGTIGVVSDPHEIANVLGTNGVEFMIEDGKRVPLKFWFGAPSCVPATLFETNGEKLDSSQVEELLKRNDIKYLAEMMNFPGVISGDEEVKRKIQSARKLGKKIDGHSPGLSGEKLRKYVEAGITTDHECSTLNEAKEKIGLGMKILIREGSAARNLNSLKDLYKSNPADVMLCSDDIHPEMLQRRHINKLIGLLIKEGYDIFDVIRSATINPVEHYKLNAGLLRTGDSADIITVDSLNEMNVIESWIDGQKVFGRGRVLFQYKPAKPLNKFNCNEITESSLQIKNIGKKLRVIEATEGDLITKEILIDTGQAPIVETNTGADILKIVVKDRYNDSPPSIGFIKGFNLKHGAFAGSVAHDSHNIIAVGVSDSEIVKVINEIIRLKGGLAVLSGNDIASLQLNVAGIMSDRPCNEVAAGYEELSGLVKGMGCTLSAPFMTLSFMALLVIPELKLSDRGLFSGKTFSFVSLFEE